MATLKIVTDHKWKQFRDRSEVPARLASDFDWLDADTDDGFVTIRPLVVCS